MAHRKREHAAMVRDCNEYLKGNCRFISEACWFSHGDNVSNGGGLDNSKNQSSQSDFQKVRENLKPPFSNHNQEKETKQQNQ